MSGDEAGVGSDTVASDTVRLAMRFALHVLAFCEEGKRVGERGFVVDIDTESVCESVVSYGTSVKL